MPLHGIDHATTIRAIDDIWFPRPCEFENPRQQGVNQEPEKGPKKPLMFFLNLLFHRNDRRQHTANSFADAFTSNIKSADGRINERVSILSTVPPSQSHPSRFISALILMAGKENST